MGRLRNQIQSKRLIFTQFCCAVKPSLGKSMHPRVEPKHENLFFYDKKKIPPGCLPAFLQPPPPFTALNTQWVGETVRDVPDQTDHR